jgi:outer membrane protein TolC
MLPDTSRGSVEANISSLPKPNSVTSADPKAAPPYRSLTAQQCACLTIAASPVARLQQEEVSLVSAGPLGNRRGSLRSAVLLYSAQELQNQAAGSALEAYYHLAEAEGKADLLAKGIEELSHAQSETEATVKRGLKPPVALDVWMRQLLTARSDSIQAQTTIDKLNSELRTLAGLQQCGENWRIWNPEQYQVSDTPIDAEAAVAIGLASRPELLLLRTLVGEAGLGSTSVMDDLLHSISPLLGAHPHPMLCVLVKPFTILAGHADAQTRRSQLSEYLSERENAVAEEIRQAVNALNNRTQLVALASARERSWAEKVNDIRSRQQQGLASFAEVAAANLDWFKARGDVIQEVMAWHVAWVKLRQAQGLFPSDCRASGYCR